MVEIKAIVNEEPQSIPASEERFLDAAEIEGLLNQDGCIKRTTVRVQLQALAQKMRRDGNALKRVEASHKKLEDAKEEDGESDKQKKNDTAFVDAVTEEKESTPSTPIAVSPASPTPAKRPVQSSSVKYKTIDRFSFDAGSYNSPTVTIYITSLPNVGAVPREQIKCTFTATSFDLTIEDYKGANYRLLKDNLDKDIDAEKSKCIVKPNKIIIKLAKVKGEYGSYDSWTDLTSKKTKEAKSRAAKDPSASIMDLMKDMYDSGDDNMKKMIGETMLKQREGTLNKDGGMGGMGGLDMPGL